MAKTKVKRVRKVRHRARGSKAAGWLKGMTAVDREALKWSVALVFGLLALVIVWAKLR